MGSNTGIFDLFRRIQWIVRGKRELLLIERDDGSFSASCVCDVFNATIDVSITREQALELLGSTRRLIQDVFPNLDPRVREMFVTGLTPAELDMTFFGEAKAREAYAGLGYDFSDE